MDYETVEFDYGFIEDSQTAIQGNKAEEAYYNGQKRAGANILGGIGLLTELIFGKFEVKKKPSTPEERLAIATNLRQRFSNEYIERVFKIPGEKGGQFINYVEDEGVPQSLLKEENEITLLELMYVRAEEFSKLSE